MNHGALPVEHGGFSSRDLIFVGDIASPASSLVRCTASRGEVYNLASGVETSILDLASLINEPTGNPTPIAFAPARDWDRSGRPFGAPDKARDHLGFVAATTLRDGLADRIAWTRTNCDRIRICMLRHARLIPGLYTSLGDVSH